MQFTTLVKAIEIFNLFLKSEGTLNFEEISNFLKMPRSTTYKYLAILKDYGLLDYDHEEKEYRLGLKFIAYGSFVQSKIPLEKVALPYMRALAQEINETVFLSYLSSGVAYCLERVGSESGIVFSMQRGANLPLYCGASAKVLLSALSEKEIDDILQRTMLIPFTKNTITDPAKLKQNIRETKKKGYAFSEGEADEGARGVAAPIINEKLRITAGLCVAGPTSRMNDSKLPEIIKLVTTCASKITEDLRRLS